MLTASRLAVKAVLLLARLARTRTSRLPLRRSALVSPLTLYVWVVSVVGSAVLTSSVPLAAPLT